MCVQTSDWYLKNLSIITLKTQSNRSFVVKFNFEMQERIAKISMGGGEVGFSGTTSPAAKVCG